MPSSISILIPTHNRGELLGRTLASLAAMDIPPGLSPARVELVVCANACTDNTRERVEAFARSAPWPVRCVVEPRAGLGRARNACVHASRHEICALLDDDIQAPRTWLSEMLKAYDEHPADIVAGRIELWWEAVQRPAWITPNMERSLSQLERGDRVIELAEPDATGANFSFRREVYALVGPFRSDLDRIGNQLLGGGETLFVRDAMARGKRLFYAPGPWVKHWVAPNRITPQYLAGVTQGSSFANVVMKPTFGPLAAARSITLGLCRLAGFAPVVALARITNNQPLLIKAACRQAAGRGQLRGALARLNRGPLKPEPPEHSNTSPA